MHKLGEGERNGWEKMGGHQWFNPGLYLYNVHGNEEWYTLKNKL